MTPSNADRAPLRFTGTAHGFFSNGGRDPRGNVRAQILDSGEATLLGSFRLVARELVNLDAGTVADGSFTITTASGDTIAGSYAGEAWLAGDGVVDYELSGSIERGTGRFAASSGSIAFSGHADTATGIRHESVTGTVETKGGRDAG